MLGVIYGFRSLWTFQGILISYSHISKINIYWEFRNAQSAATPRNAVVDGESKVEIARPCDILSRMYHIACDSCFQLIAFLSLVHKIITLIIKPLLYKYWMWCMNSYIYFALVLKLLELWIFEYAESW